VNGAKIDSVIRRFSAALACCGCLIGMPPGAAAQAPDPLAALDRSVASAEESLRLGERQLADSRYRTVLLHGWMILGTIAANDGRLADARAAFERASSSAVDSGVAQRSLAIVQLQMGASAPALEVLTRLAAASPRDVEVRLTLAQALLAAGRPGEATQELEEVRASGVVDAELTFALASGYLRLKKLANAEALFAALAAERPRPETHVLIGRTYRDHLYYAQARAAFKRALAMNPRTRRAHYYLGTTALMEEGVVRLDQAIAEFRQELVLSPGDRTTTLRLAMALVEARNHREALPLLESSVRTAPDAPEAWVFLGRCQSGLDRAADAVVSFRRALELMTKNEAGTRDRANDPERLRMLHYQLGTALRSTGAAAEADREFAEAQRLSVARTEADRERLSQYLADAPEPLHLFPLEMRGFETLSSAERTAAANRARAALVRSYLNLGIMHAQAGRFARAAELFESSAEIDANFPQVQYSLGVAYFNAQRYDKAVPALKRAVDQSIKDAQPQNADLTRMLALASLNADDYAAAADLLRDDPKLGSDPALQYAYGLALVRSDRAAEAERIFSRVLAQNPEIPELHVLVGQAHAAQGDFESAIASLRRAIAIAPTVAEANAALGVIYLRQGDLPAARDALAAEVSAHPNDIKTRNTLATVLDLQGQSDEALQHLRAAIAINPNYAAARYLFGKILLARGAAAEAVEHLELAARIAPDDANTHYQLGQAYQRLGRTELAAREFETHQRLKAKARGGHP
jgi:tetratricopeptide (TPR) repeat protein